MTTRPRARLAAVLAALSLVGCSSHTFVDDMDGYQPLVRAWEEKAAGADLSAPGAVAEVLDPAVFRVDHPQLWDDFQYRVLPDQGDEPTLALWMARTGADPFEPEVVHEHACAAVRVQDHRFVLEGTDCPADTPTTPPAEDDLSPVVPAQGQRPWAKPGTGDLTHVCPAGEVEVVADQLSTAGNFDELRMSVRNVTDSPCDVVGSPGLRLITGGEARVLSRGGGAQRVRLQPGESTTTTLSWRPTSGGVDQPQTLEVTTGRVDAVQVHFGYGTPRRPFHLESGGITVVPWSAPTTQVSLGDVGRVTQFVAPTCQPDALTAALSPVHSSSDEQTNPNRGGATLAISNNSYLPCQLDHLWLRTTSDQPAQSTHSPQPSPMTPVSTNLRDRLWLPGQRRELQLRWTTSTTAPFARIWLGWTAGKVPVHSRGAQMPATVTNVELQD
ncbi:DUF4232 domain-containing protein [Luteococcus sp. Sow4_B9]|uniref:DUF4232 domain-containing protein n=1 Tax=Luteococcus sp. Sow4_B9 TaxID=3438792 RepID=UPI003F9C8971